MKITLRHLRQLIREAIADMGVIAHPGDWVAEDLKTGKLLMNFGAEEPTQDELVALSRDTGVYMCDIYVDQYED